MRISTFVPVANTEEVKVIRGGDESLSCSIMTAKANHPVKRCAPSAAIIWHGEQLVFYPRPS